jgi:hypothetical protein
MAPGAVLHAEEEVARAAVEHAHLQALAWQPCIQSAREKQPGGTNSRHSTKHVVTSPGQEEKYQYKHAEARGSSNGILIQAA